MPPAATRILVDENIPDAKRLFAPFGSVHVVPARDIDSELVKDFNVLLIRSVTRVNDDLLSLSPVRFVGTATSGVDHVDLDVVARHGAAFASAPGSNAESVVEYVLAALLEVLAQRKVENPESITVGVVGCGQVGGRLLPRLRALGFSVMAHDPFVDLDPSYSPVPIERVLRECDVVTLHVPLTKAGSAAAKGHPTQHLISAESLEMMRPDAILINTARGGVVDGSAVLHARPTSAGRAFIFDVWENEPTPDPSLVDLSFLATPHIAGYSYDGKLRGALMLRDALADFLSTPLGAAEAESAPPTILRSPADDSTVDALQALSSAAYDIRSDDARMRAAMTSPQGERGQRFTALRTEYPVRREFSQFAVRANQLDPALHHAVKVGLGMRLV